MVEDLMVLWYLPQRQKQIPVGKTTAFYLWLLPPVHIRLKYLRESDG